MIVHERKTQFGWADDNGLGDVLIRQIIAGLKTATCSPKEDYTAEEVRVLYASSGQRSTVVDKAGVPLCNVRIRAVYDTPFGRPDPRLVRGEGNGDVTPQGDDRRGRNRYGVHGPGAPLDCPLSVAPLSTPDVMPAHQRRAPIACMMLLLIVCSASADSQTPVLAAQSIRRVKP